jgi:SAM-dependent methyltransferase
MPSSTDYSAVKDELAHQSPKEISAMFGRVAARYDIMNFAMGGGLDSYWRRRLVRTVAAQQPARVLDLATGSGDVLLALRRHQAYTECAIGADFCLPMLLQAKAKKVTNLLVGDGLQLPFPDASFDAVTISWGLRNFADRLAGLRENAPRLASRRPGLRPRIFASRRMAGLLLLLVHAPRHAQVRAIHHAGTGRLRISRRLDPGLSPPARVGRHDAPSRIFLLALDESDARHRRAPCRRGLTAAGLFSLNSLYF